MRHDGHSVALAERAWESGGAKAADGGSLQAGDPSRSGLLAMFSRRRLVIIWGSAGESQGNRITCPSRLRAPSKQRPDSGSNQGSRTPMTIKLSARVQAVKPSATLAITARAKELRAAGKDVIGLGAGEPDFDTPDHIKEAAIDAIRDGFTKYTAVDGTPELKRAIIAKFQRDNGLDYAPEQILVSCGGKQSFFNLAQAVLDPGDEVIIPAPYWVSYPDMVLLAGAAPVLVHAGAEQRFKITPDQLKAAMTDQTRLVVINSPSNPTGMAYSRDELAALGEVLREFPRRSSPPTTCTSTSAGNASPSSTSSTPARTWPRAPWC